MDDVQSFMSASVCRNEQAGDLKATLEPAYPVVRVDFMVCDSQHMLSEPIQPKYLKAEQEILLGPACWLWDYLRRSGMRGFFLPLSGGIDSCSTALIVHQMCKLIFAKISECDVGVIADVQRITGFIPKDYKELTTSLFVTCYMESQHSSGTTKSRAKRLADVISRYVRA